MTSSRDTVREALAILRAKQNPHVKSFWVLLRHGQTVDADMRKRVDKSLFKGECQEYLKEKGVGYVDRFTQGVRTLTIYPDNREPCGIPPGTDDCVIWAKAVLAAHGAETREVEG